MHQRVLRVVARCWPCHWQLLEQGGGKRVVFSGWEGRRLDPLHLETGHVDFSRLFLVPALQVLSFGWLVGRARDAGFRDSAALADKWLGEAFILFVVGGVGVLNHVLARAHHRARQRGLDLRRLVGYFLYDGLSALR
jgi:hypothetical protein